MASVTLFSIRIVTVLSSTGDFFVGKKKRMRSLVFYKR